MNSHQTVIPLESEEAARRETVAPERAWLGVVSAEHARHASRHGWIQLNHGARHNVARLRRGDGFVFYSPTECRGERTRLRAFTALGTVVDDEPHLADEVVDMGARGTLRPWRRTVDFAAVHAVALHTVTHELALTRERNWGYGLRFGFLPLTVADFEVLRGAMRR
ncbi:EVE domain-containing protein [Streptomyces sp. NPDC005820]|uniref:EVE domain-containing protein n=1 Tax=Streptomyces sp. NPDC005820 TaxID=3157069 RepID=UPI0033E00C3E